MKRLITFLLFALSLSAQTKQLGPVKTAGPSKRTFGSGGTPPAFVSTAKCNNAASGTCTSSGLSIPSGDIIFVEIAQRGNATASVSDSHSDASTCGGVLAYEVSNDNSVQGCTMVAGATVTTVTCVAGAVDAVECLMAWYTPGSVAGTVDKSTGQDQPNVTTWTSGATATLTSSNELVVDIWGILNPGITSTYSDGATSRNTCAGGVYSCALADRNVSTTAAVTASGTFSGATFAAAGIVTVK